MQNKVVHTMARACQDQNVTTVRFNFRGVGASAGKHDDGVGESEDAAVVADWARKATGASGCGRSASRSGDSSPIDWRRYAMRLRW